MRYKAVLLSLAGVITHTADEHFKAWQMLGKELGFELPQSLYEELKSVPRMRALDLVLASQGLEESFSLLDKHELAAKKTKYYHDLTQKIGPRDVLPGVEDILKRLVHKGIKIALVSGSRSGRELLSQMKLLKYFDIVIDPAKISRGKPDPEIFLKAAAQLQVAPDDCIVVDDGFVGIEGAKAAGMLAIGIGKPEILTNTEHVFKNLEEAGHFLFSELNDKN